MTAVRAVCGRLAEISAADGVIAEPRLAAGLPRDVARGE
jgi:hypothetical protein